MHPIVYLPLEIKQRELDSRLLIAAFILRAGYPVVFGQQWGMFNNGKSLPKGAVLFKTVNAIQASNMAFFKSLGHLVAATDEEVLVCTDDACFFEVFSDIAASHCDLFFCHSDIHKEAVDRRYPTLSGKTRMVGNARLDFLAPGVREFFREDANAHIAEHGPYILFNTNYGQMNSLWNSMEFIKDVAGRAGLMNPDDPRSVSEYEEKLQWESRNRDEIMALMRWTVTNMERHKVIIRPHPGEAIDFWRASFPDSSRVTIVPRSNPHSWLLGADMVVHTSCTTGLESALLGTPGINLIPKDHPTFKFVTHWVNPTFERWQEAAAAMSTYLSAGEGPVNDLRPKCEAALKKFFPAHGEGIAAIRIAEGVCELLSNEGVGPVKSGEFTFETPGYLHAVRKDAVKDKFSLSMDELVARLHGLVKGFGVNLKAQIRQLDDSLFLMVPGDP